MCHMCKDTFNENQRCIFIESCHCPSWLLLQAIKSAVSMCSMCQYHNHGIPSRSEASLRNIRVLVSPGRGNPSGIPRDVRIIMTLLLSTNQHDWIP